MGLELGLGIGLGLGLGLWLKATGASDLGVGGRVRLDPLEAYEGW